MTGAEGREGPGAVVEAEGGVLRVVIDRPARKGSLDPPAVRRVSGRDAAAWGMIHRAVPEDGPDAAVDELVAEFAAPTERRDATFEGR